MENTEEIPKPIFSDFVLNNAEGVQKLDGRYYHFSEVISLLKKYDKMLKDK